MPLRTNFKTLASYFTDLKIVKAEKQRKLSLPLTANPLSV